MVSELMRRREMMEKGDNYLDGWEIGYYNGVGADNPVANANYIRSPYIMIPSTCNTIKWSCPTQMPEYNRATLYDDNKAYLTYINAFGATSTYEVSIIGRGFAYMRIAFWLEDIDNSYILDVTNQEYLWKGKNVV